MVISVIKENKNIDVVLITIIIVMIKEPFL